MTIYELPYVCQESAPLSPAVTLYLKIWRFSRSPLMVSASMLALLEQKHKFHA